jgi:hypothetical protein
MGGMSSWSGAAESEGLGASSWGPGKDAALVVMFAEQPARHPTPS